MKRLFYLLTLLTAGFIINSCSDDSVSETVIDTTKQIKPDSVMNFNTYIKGTADTITYYSLRENRKIDSIEANTTNWDIAFNRTSIFVNCGFRGPGNGGAFVMNNTDFWSLETIPADSTFYTETETTKAIPLSGKGWYSYDYEKMEISAIPGRTLVIRTADGKYAKMQVFSYYDGYPNNIPEDANIRLDKYYSFRFTYQPNGTKSFLK